MAYAKLIDYDVVNSSTIATYTVYCDSVSIGYKINTDASPYANGGAVSEVQNQTYNNPIYTLQGVIITEDSGTLTYDKLRELSTRQYNPDSKYLRLDIDYGVDSSSLLPDSTGATSGIKVVITGFNASLGLNKAPSSGKRAGIGTISFIETA